MLPHRLTARIAAPVLAWALAALCGAAEPPGKQFDLSIAGGAVPTAQRVLRVVKGDAVRLRVTSDVPGELHLHAYRLEAKVGPASPAELTFNAFATGRFRLEWHPAGAPAAGSHHAPPLAFLDVHPK